MKETPGLLLRNDEQGKFLSVDMDQFVFTKDYYETERSFDLEKSISEFRSIWKSANEVLKMKDIRRIGIVAEHQVSVTQGTSGKTLIAAFTKIRPLGHPAKVQLRYEDRALTREGAIPNINTNAFFNVIYDIYDSELDVNHPLVDHINANIDFQKYYSPLFNGNVSDEVKVLKTEFLKKRNSFEADLKERGIV